MTPPYPEKKKTEILTQAVEMLEDGQSLREIARQLGVLEQTLRLWFRTSDHWSTQYARARDVGLDVEADNLEHLVKEAKVEDRTELGKLQLLVDVKKWRLSKLAPKRYGDRLELAGDSNAPLKVEYINALKQRQEKQA